ncbi:MAG: helix-turn-helix transcriptional regulator [Muribaculaceae bacterium]|nr:helix-turn-helix transcriptional regulator [Muribaculaceae bacterium]
MNRIKEILKEKGVTQQELANRLGVTRMSIVKTLAGNPSQETLERIADALNIPIWQLFISPEEIQREKGQLICPNCGVALELKIKEKG